MSNTTPEEGKKCEICDCWRTGIEDFRMENCGCTACHKEEKPKGWVYRFRARLMELDDCNTHMNNINEPIKGDIYFDGIEIERFISQILSEAIEATKEEVRQAIKTLQMEETPPFSASDEIREKAKLINEKLMPSVKEALLSLPTLSIINKHKNK